ncbi:MAG: reductive dehalogenase domain-containing protein [Candidatus Promineifilaceae bacterium]
MPSSVIDTLNGLLIAIGLLSTGFMFLFATVSAREGEPIATRRASVGAVLVAMPFFAAGIVGITYNTAVPGLVLVVLASGAVLVLLLQIGSRFPDEEETPRVRFDERDIMFARRALEQGSDRYEAYYRNNPSKKELDEKFRKRPGLMAEGALYYEPLSAASAEASFATVASFQADLDREENSTQQLPVNPDRMSQYLKRWSKKLGVVSSGITDLKDYHLYSHIGRGDRYGEPVVLDHEFAFAITVEMDKQTLDHAPYGPTVMESAQQYLNSGAIAVQVAEFIRQLGYSARAHIDGSYRVICPLVARDAGLGEIGRMGLLITPELGPRVRLAVVTTDMPLSTDKRKRDQTMIDFCSICLKCADVCPSKSIPFGQREEIDGVLRWRIDPESCFTYWCTIGTDCGLCMRCCPFSHPDNTMHNIVRAGVRRSAPFRRLALTLDDLFYGRIPARTEVPSWMEVGPSD